MCVCVVRNCFDKARWMLFGWWDNSIMRSGLLEKVVGVERRAFCGILTH